MSHFKTYSVQERLIEYQEQQIETPEMTGVFLLEKALHQAVIKGDFLKVKDLLEKGASVNPWQYPDEVIHDLLDKSRKSKIVGRTGAFATAIIEHQQDMIDFMWPMADIAHHGFRFLTIAIDCGNIAVVRRLLQEPLFQTYPKPIPKTTTSSISQSRDLWKDVAEFSFRHYGDRFEQEKISNEIFDLVFQHLQKILQPTEYHVRQFFGRKIEPITDHMWKTLMPYGVNEDVFLTLLYHGNDEGCEALFPQFIQNIQDVDVYHSNYLGMAFVGAFIKYPKKRTQWVQYAKAVFTENQNYGSYYAIQVLRSFLSNPVGDLGVLNQRIKASYFPQKSFSVSIEEQKFLKAFFFQMLDFDKLFNWIMGRENDPYSQIRNYYKHLNWTLFNLDDFSFSFTPDIDQKILQEIGLDYSKMPLFCGRIEKQALLQTIPNVDSNFDSNPKRL